MHFEKITKKSGTLEYSFRFRDPQTKKLKRLARDLTPRMNTDEEANEFCQKWNAREDAARVRGQERLAWQRKFYNFENLLSIYSEHMKRQAPNSWKNSVFFMRHYVLDFYLNKMNVPNLELWHRYYLDFTEWLIKDATLVRQTEKQTHISYGSKNHCIRSLNTFLRYMKLKNQINHFSPCPSFKSHLLNTRGADDLVSEDEYNTIYNELTQLNEEVADFYCLLYHSGMRLNEMRGLSLADVFPGKIPMENINNELERFGFSTYGHIALTSQPVNDHLGTLRNSDGHVERKPLKTRKAMTSKEGRLIPINDKMAFNTLVKLYKKAEQDFQEKKHGPNRSDYLFFDTVTKNKISFTLKSVYDKFHWRYKSPHCLRHTRATYLVGKTLNPILARLILGHTKNETTARYIHLHEDVIRRAKNVAPEQASAMEFVR